MMIAAVAMFTLAAAWVAFGLAVGAVLAYDELTGHRRIIEAQIAHAAAQRAARYPWAPPVRDLCPICSTAAHAGGCPMPELPPEPLRPALNLLDAA